MKQGPAAFFDREIDQTSWAIAAAWPYWDEMGLALSARVKDLEKRTGAQVNPDGFKSILQRWKLEIPKVGRGKARKVVAAPSEELVATLSEPPPLHFDPIKEELRQLRDYSPEADEEFSLGGSLDLNFDFDPPLQMSSRRKR